MSELVEHITDARNNGTINVYAVRYNQREKTDNVAVALPGNLNFDFRHDFCENIIQYEDAQEVAFNPTSNGLEDGTYEYIPLSNVREKWDVFANLLDDSLNYHGAENRKKRYPSQRTGELFVLTLCEIMDWNPDYRYKVLGKMVQANGKALIAFDLTSSECFPKVVNRDGKKVSSRQSVFAEQWSGKFGPTYSESRRSLAVKTFDNYTVITVNGKKTEVHPQAQPQQQGSMGDSL